MTNIPTPLTHALAGAMVVVWVLVALSIGESRAAMDAGFIPASISGAVTQPIPAFLTPLTSSFLHGGLMHISFNLIMLIFCGRWVESALGAKLTGILFILGAYAAALTQWAVDPNSTVPMIGASGAISAFVGAYALMFSQKKTNAIGPFSAHSVRILWLAAAWIVLQLLIGVAYGAEDGGGIAIWAHIGGFVAGLLLARPMLRHRYRES